MRKAQLTVSALLIILLLAACAPVAAPVSTPEVKPPVSAPAPTSTPPKLAAAPAKPAWQVEWDKTLSAAKKEGRLVLYTSMGAEPRQIITSAFQSKYGVGIESVSGRSPELYAKVSAERRAGVYSPDVVISGSTTYRDFPGLLEFLEPTLILPELTETELSKKTWYFGEVPWANKARTWLIGLLDFQLNTVVNTNLVKADEIKAYRDLLDPRWKGKISLDDPRISGMGNMWFAVVLEVGDVDVNFFRDLLTKQDLFVTRDRRLQVDWLARGKHAIAIAPYVSTVTEYIALGAPLHEFNPGTPFASGSTSGIGIWKNAPHPDAAKLFVNWLLSQEGATFHSKAIGIQSRRLDVSSTHLRPSKVVPPDLKVFRSDSEEFAEKRITVYTPLTKEVFGP